MAKNDEVVELVKIELTNLERLKDELKELLSIRKEKNSYEVRAAGSILHDFYCGIEKIFERIATMLDNNFPSGVNWHTELLIQMGRTLNGTRENVISDQLIKRLKEFLRFRHLFRHIYGFELKWERIQPLCVELEHVFIDFKKEMEIFFRGSIPDPF